MNRLIPFLVLLLCCAAARGQSAPDTLQLLRSEKVYFDFARWELRPEGDRLLVALADSLGEAEGLRIYITAHTDSIGTGAANEQLSRKRAASVREKLLQSGLPDSVIRITAYGERRPAAANETEEGRQANRRATVDVFQVLPLTRLHVEVVAAGSGDPLPAELILHSRDFRDTLTTGEDGKLTYTLRAPLIMGIDAFATGYFFETSMQKVPARPEHHVRIELRRAEAGEKADLANLYFVGNQAVLLPRSEPELPKILRFVRLNDNLTFEIAGHVNYPNTPPVGEDSWEYELSVRRAKLVYDYLLANGIPPDRISYQGYGNWEMRYPYARSEKEQELNRRVEIRVLE